MNRGKGLAIQKKRTETIHHIGARAERKVERKLLEDLKRVTGKQTLLFELADAPTLYRSFHGSHCCAGLGVEPSS